MQDVALTAILIGIGFLIYLVKVSLPAYVRRKAENLAQKEDLQILTDITERIRNQFDKVGLVHRIQFEAEFRAYQDIWRLGQNAFKENVRLNLLVVKGSRTQEQFSIFET